MSAERRLSGAEEAYLGPVVVAQWVDLGWLVTTPLAVTPHGRGALRRAYAGQKVAPLAGDTHPGGAEAWPGRRARLSGRTA